MSDKDEKQVGFEVDQEAYEQAKQKLEWGGMSRILRERVHEVAYGTETTERTRLKEKLQQLRKDRREKQKEIEDKQQEKDEIDREIERVEERLDTLMDQDGEYDGFLQGLEADLHEGQRLDPQHGKIETAAEIGDTKPQDVVKDLKERNPEVPKVAFELPSQAEPANWKEATEGYNKI